MMLATGMAALTILNAQVSVGGLPYALRVGMDHTQVPEVMAAPLDMAAIAIEDAQRADAGMLPLYSRFAAIGADPFTDGQWTLLPNGDRLWQLKITSPGALAVELFWSAFHLPENAMLFVYSPDGSQVLGGFTSYNNRGSGLFASALIDGESCFVEYYEPLAVTGQGSFKIDHVGHAYRMAGAAADPCEVDVICSEGADWWQQRNGVVRLSVTGSIGSGWCSGSVVNNVEQDCKPYILSAYHCGLPGETDNFSLWKAYFRYQRSSCGTGSAFANKVMTGSVKRADSNDNGGDTGSDFLLIEMEDPIPDNFAAYYNGWSALNSASTGGVSIHHPAGSEKKISTFTGTTISSNWGGVGGTHWRLTWSSTANGWGVTEGGSSGSPLFNNAGLIMGTLTGGASCCTSNGCGPGTGPTAPDFYGKMSYHWDSNPGPATEHLNVWLDPNGTGATTLNGSFDPCGNYTVYTSLEEMEAATATTVMPNPAIDAFTVEFTGIDVPVDRVEVLDPAGRPVHTEQVLVGSRVTVRTQDWANGTYLVRLLNDQGQVGAGRVIIAR